MNLKKKIIEKYLSVLSKIEKLNFLCCDLITDRHVFNVLFCKHYIIIKLYRQLYMHNRLNILVIFNLFLCMYSLSDIKISNFKIGGLCFSLDKYILALKN